MVQRRVPYWMQIARIFSEERRLREIGAVEVPDNLEHQQMLDKVTLGIVKVLKEHDPDFDETLFYINED